MTERKWVLREIEEEVCERLQAELGVLPLTAKLLSNRGLDSADKVKAFLNKDEIPLHDPYLLKDMDRAVERIRRAIDNKERVCIYGDYDVDGVTSTMMLYDYLTGRGVKCEYFIPDRISEGYGLSLPVIQRMVGRVDMIITVDTGITAIDEALYAKEQGIDMVITDHHNCREIIPDAVAVVNPHREDCAYPFKNLAGVGVVFKLLCAVDGDTKSICNTDDPVVHFYAIGGENSRLDIARDLLGVAIRRTQNMDFYEIAIFKSQSGCINAGQLRKERAAMLGIVFVKSVVIDIHIDPQPFVFLYP